MLKIVDLCKSHRNKDVNVLTFAWRFGAPVRIQIRYFASDLACITQYVRFLREKKNRKQFDEFFSSTKISKVCNAQPSNSGPLRIYLNKMLQN